MGCPNSLPQHIMRDAIHAKHMQYVWSICFTHCRSVNSANGKILPREVKKAFHTAWPNIVHHIEDETSLESDNKVEWYSDCPNDLMDDLRLVEEKASVEQDCHQKADQKLPQANAKIAELEAKLASFQKELTVLRKQDKWTPIDQGNPFNFSYSESEATSGRSSQKRKKREAFPPSIQYRGFFPDEAGMSVPADELMVALPASSQVVGSQTTLLWEHLPTLRIVLL